MTWTSFEVSAWDEAGVRVVQVTGEFDAVACEQFEKLARSDTAELLVVDLRQVTFMDSSALGQLMTLQRRTEASACKLAILRPEGAADRIFKLTGMDGHLPLHDGRVPLLAHFNYG